MDRGSSKLKTSFLTFFVHFVFTVSYVRLSSKVTLSNPAKSPSFLTLSKVRPEGEPKKYVYMCLNRGKKGEQTKVKYGGSMEADFAAAAEKLSASRNLLWERPWCANEKKETKKKKAKRDAYQSTLFFGRRKGLPRMEGRLAKAHLSHFHGFVNFKLDCQREPVVSRTGRVFKGASSPSNFTPLPQIFAFASTKELC